MEANQAVVEAVEQLGRGQGRHGRAGGAGVAPRKRPNIVPIFGTRRLDRVKENLGAAEVSLSNEDMAAIEARLSRIEVTGSGCRPLSSNCLTASPLAPVRFDSGIGGTSRTLPSTVSEAPRCSWRCAKVRRQLYWCALFQARRSDIGPSPLPAGTACGHDLWLRVRDRG